MRAQMRVFHLWLDIVVGDYNLFYTFMHILWIFEEEK